MSQGQNGLQKPFKSIATQSTKRLKKERNKEIIDRANVKGTAQEAVCHTSTPDCSVSI